MWSDFVSRAAAGTAEAGAGSGQALGGEVHARDEVSAVEGMLRVPDWLETFRVRGGMFETPPLAPFGMFDCVPLHGFGSLARIIVSQPCEEVPWEHVSASMPTRCPDWGEMDLIKRTFWDPRACVVQFHPPIAEHVNVHPYCLHLWRPSHVEMPRPPGIAVGLNFETRGGR